MASKETNLKRPHQQRDCADQVVPGKMCKEVSEKPSIDDEYNIDIDVFDDENCILSDHDINILSDYISKQSENNDESMKGGPKICEQESNSHSTTLEKKDFQDVVINEIIKLSDGEDSDENNSILSDYIDDQSDDKMWNIPLSKGLKGNYNSESKPDSEGSNIKIAKEYNKERLLKNFKRSLMCIKKLNEWSQLTAFQERSKERNYYFINKYKNEMKRQTFKAKNSSNDIAPPSISANISNKGPHIGNVKSTNASAKLSNSTMIQKKAADSTSSKTSAAKPNNKISIEEQNWTKRYNRFRNSLRLLNRRDPSKLNEMEIFQKDKLMKYVQNYENRHKTESTIPALPTTGSGNGNLKSNASKRVNAKTETVVKKSAVFGGVVGSKIPTIASSTTKANPNNTNSGNKSKRTQLAPKKAKVGTIPRYGMNFLTQATIGIIPNVTQQVQSDLERLNASNLSNPNYFTPYNDQVQSNICVWQQSQNIIVPNPSNMNTNQYQFPSGCQEWLPATTSSGFQINNEQYNSPNILTQSITNKGNIASYYPQEYYSNTLSNCVTTLAAPETIVDNEINTSASWLDRLTTSSSYNKNQMESGTNSMSHLPSQSNERVSLLTKSIPTSIPDTKRRIQINSPSAVSTTTIKHHTDDEIFSSEPAWNPSYEPISPTTTDSKEIDRSPKQKMGMTNSTPTPAHTLPMKLKVAIIDRSDHNGRLAKDKWKLIEEKLLQALIREIHNKDQDEIFTAYNGFEWEKGVKVIECNNDKAVRFLENSLRNMGDLAENIAVVPSGEVLNRTTIWIRIPPPILSMDAALKLLKQQNRDLISDNWRIVQLQEEKGCVIVLLEVSIMSVDRIKKSNNMIQFGLNKLKVSYPMNLPDNMSSR